MDFFEKNKQELFLVPTFFLKWILKKILGSFREKNQ